MRMRNPVQVQDDEEDDEEDDEGGFLCRGATIR
jgi:hypothetical protein